MNRVKYEWIVHTNRILEILSLFLCTCEFERRISMLWTNCQYYRFGQPVPLSWYTCGKNNRNKTPEIQRSLGLPYIFSSFCFLFFLCLYSNFRLMREITNKVRINTISCINDKSKYLAPVTIKSVEIVPFTTKKIITHNPPFFQFILYYRYDKLN